MAMGRSCALAAADSWFTSFGAVSHFSSLATRAGVSTAAVACAVAASIHSTAARPAVSAVATAAAVIAVTVATPAMTGTATGAAVTAVAAAASMSPDRVREDQADRERDEEDNDGFHDSVGSHITVQSIVKKTLYAPLNSNQGKP